MLNPAAGSDKTDSIEVFPYVHMILSSTNILTYRLHPKVYTIEFLLSLKDLSQCKEKPADLPDFIDKDKVSYDGPGGKPIRKQRRGGPAGGDDAGDASQGVGHESHFEDPGANNWGKGKGKRRDHYNGWQPSNPENHEEEFNQGAAKGGKGAGAPRVPGQRIIPGKGIRNNPNPTPPSGTPALAASWDHQPALANVYTKQHQGVTGAPTQVAKGLDAFSLGDIRQAERMMENGRMNIDEYARRMAAGEIAKTTAPVSTSGGFFAEDDDDTTRRPWAAGARIIPGSHQRVSPPAPPSPPVQQGKDSNVAGLALLQMLVDRKAAAPAAPKAVPAPAAPPRQLSQQQINDLIAMSKRAAPKPKAAQIVPGQQARMNAPPPAPPQVANPQVAALLEQLHRQQVAQQQAAAGSQQATPPECQQQ